MFDRFILELSWDLVVVTLIIAFVAIVRYYWTFDIPSAELSLEGHRWQTGDLIAVSYPFSFGAFVRVWSCSVWSHVGMIWVDPDTKIPHVMESASYNDPDSGILCLPLNRWVHINRHCLLGVRSLSLNTVDPIQARNAFEARRRYGRLDSLHPGWTRLLWKSEYILSTKIDQTCYEFTTSLLQDLGVIRPFWSDSTYFPGQLMNSSLDLCTGYDYDPPCRLVWTGKDESPIDSDQ